MIQKKMSLVIGILFAVIIGLALYLSSLVENLPDEYFSTKTEPIKRPQLNIQSLKIPCFYKGYDLEVKAKTVDKELMLNFRLQNADDKEPVFVFNRQISPVADRVLYLKTVDLLSKTHPSDNIYTPRKGNAACLATDILLYKTDMPKADARPDYVYVNVVRGNAVFDWLNQFVFREKEFVDAAILSKTGSLAEEAK